MAQNYGSITPYLVIKNAEKAIEFYQELKGRAEDLFNQ